MGTEKSHRSGWVALVGRPNVGKSTLLNQLLGQKIAATTHKPQTTRRNLLGILNSEDSQVLLLDTPGHHRAKGPLNRFMVQQVTEALRDADVIAYVVEGREDGNITPGNDRIMQYIKNRPQVPVIVLINKVDRVKRKDALLLQIKAYSDILGEQVRAIVPISAMKKNGLDRVVAAMSEALPFGPRYFEGDEITDQSERMIVGELIREKVILETRDELPYAAAVTVENFEDDRPEIVRIEAFIHVERPSQKAIVIGKGGEQIKAIGMRARKEIEHFLDSKVYLDLKVRTTERWSEKPASLQELGYGGKER